RRAVAGTPVQCAEFVPALVTTEAGDVSGLSYQLIQSMATFVESAEADLRADFRGVMIDRARFDAALVARAEKSGAVCRFGVVLTGIGDDGVVRLSDGSDVRPRLLIGADGPRSLVARRAGFPAQDVAESRQMTVGLVAPMRSTDIFLSSEIVGGYGWLFPKGDRANLGVGVARSERHHLKTLLDSLHRRLADEGRVGRDVFGYTGGAIPVGGLVGPVGAIGSLPVLLAGDAAGLANPVTGAGINSAVISGVMAGEAAAKSLEAGASALADFGDDMTDLFKGALDRALNHRRRLVRIGRRSTPDDLRGGWIAYDAYWDGNENKKEAAE
ncbi:MAG TPA: NAD(P)/FAD-dependent oxidoreductase, partial [Hyphomicrobiaceae bacterium]|nr:NAD(P)/FAD-dependent oxidoreductase [Hyphomicrobiaceae bacterium]